MNYEIIKIRENADKIDECATWFNQKWGIPKEAYLDSMNDCIKNEGAVPQWYVAVSDGKIIGGLGVIENDFHNRPDLAPNVCAVFVEEEFRGQGVAGALLNFVVEDMKAMGVTTLYLLTDHTGFYERYGWEFFCYALGDGEEQESRMYIHK
ncbi:MAG: GNAT family N-acetyltransferase [Ruminococcus sp.]|nr:GNAT family N-acetyltransferase [Ruminococcus sp.]